MASQCKGCRDGGPFELPFSMAFQPIVDMHTGEIFAHEALVRGPSGEGAGSVLRIVKEENRYVFDQQCRVKAIELAARLYDPRQDVKLSINFTPPRLSRLAFGLRHRSD